MIVMSISAVATGAAALMRDRQKTSGARDKWPPRNREDRASVIEGEYEVIDEATSLGPQQQNHKLP
jgi:hypothetical protein